MPYREVPQLPENDEIFLRTFFEDDASLQGLATDNIRGMIHKAIAWFLISEIQQDRDKEAIRRLNSMLDAYFAASVTLPANFFERLYGIAVRKKPSSSPQKGAENMSSKIDNLRVRTAIHHPDVLRDIRIISVIDYLIENCVIVVPYKNDLRLFTAPLHVQDPEGRHYPIQTGIKPGIDCSHLPVMEAMINMEKQPNTIKNEKSFNLQGNLTGDIELALSIMARRWRKETFPARLALLKKGPVGFLNFWTSFKDEDELHTLQLEIPNHPPDSMIASNLLSAIKMSREAMSRNPAATAA